MRREMGRAGDKGDWKGTWAEKVEQIGDEEVGREEQG